MYFNKQLVVSVTLSKMKVNEGDLFIGGYHHRSGNRGASIDNFQIFNKALTKDEITILALANKHVMTD